jgi:predicted TIM-barrel fold metal-dependent hydrolase
MIIDVHTHLGNILTPNGGELIFRKGVKKKRVLDLVTVAEWGFYNTNPVTEWVLTSLCEDMVTRACQARNLTATLENCMRSMEQNGVEKSACMPIAPYVTFQDLKKASQTYGGVVPFTSVDFAHHEEVEARLRSDVAEGAKGLKLHPIIQKEPIASPRTFETVEAFAPHELPVLFHAGVQSYYLGEEKEEKQIPEHGDVTDAVKLCDAFPKVRFIVGHAGLMQYKQTIDLFGNRKNVYVDLSFQSPSKIKELVKAFGADRVMFASDWPWGDQKTNIACVSKACKGDTSLERRIYYDNAASLLRLSR